MSVAPADLLQPKGRIDPEYFPDDDETQVEARLQAYLDEGLLEADAGGASDVDRAVKAWGYYRAYTTITERLAGAPSTSSVDGEMNATYTSDQRATFRTAAEHYLQVFQALTTVREPLESTDDELRVASMGQVGAVRFRF